MGWNVNQDIYGGVIKMQLDKAKAKEWLNDADGYSILDPCVFRDMGLDVRSGSHSSDPALGKHRATRSDGEPGDVEGVSEFEAIDVLADELGVPSECRWPFHGRGSNFRHLRNLCWKALEVAD
jgi:hypothetical protein